MVPSYHCPKTLGEALALKAEFGPKAAFLAGGSEINNRFSSRPEALIDLRLLGLGGVESEHCGLLLGAGLTFQQLLESPVVPDFLKRAAGHLANRNVRNVATLGGHLGANRSCADLIPALLVMDSLVVTATAEIALAAYLAGEPGLILGIRVPEPGGRGFGLGHQTRTASDVSIVTAAASVTLAEGRLGQVRLAVGGVAPHVVRLPEVEVALEGKELPAPASVEALIAAAVQPMNDFRGSAAYKRHIAATLGERSLRDAARSCRVEGR